MCKSYLRKCIPAVNQVGFVSECVMGFYVAIFIVDAFEEFSNNRGFFLFQEIEETKENPNFQGDKMKRVAKKGFQTN